MPSRHCRSFIRVFAFIVFILTCGLTGSIALGQGAKQKLPDTSIPDADADQVQQRSEWFFRGRLVPRKPSAELRRRACQAKLQMRAQRAAALALRPDGAAVASPGGWIPLGPAPLPSDATGNGTQDYHQVAGRATAVAIDPADSTGNTVYIDGAQSGVWKSTNASNKTANSVLWTPVTDDQATLSIGALAIQPGNCDPAKSVILAATGEADNSADSYCGLGILRSTDAGNTWTLIRTANGGALSFSGLGGTRMAFSTTNTVVAAMAATPEGLIAGAVTANTKRGLYTSVNAGQSWTYDAVLDPGNQPTDATSATAALRRSSSFVYAIWLLFPGIVIGSVAPSGTGARRRPRLLGSIAMLFLFLTLVSSAASAAAGVVAAVTRAPRRATTVSPSLAHRLGTPTALKLLSS